MKRMHKNDGFTLVELMVTILVGSIITLAATTVLLLGIRIMHKSTSTVERQYNTRVLLTALEDLAAEGTISEVRSEKGPAPEDESLEVILSWKVLDGDKVIFSFDRAEQAIFTGTKDAGAPLLEGVTESSAVLDGKLLTFSVTTDEGAYETSVNCRLRPDDHGGDETAAILIEELIKGNGIVESTVTNYQLRNAALTVIASQYGSKGAIVGGDDDGTYYSEWYLKSKGLGGYVENPQWNENTPWCACFVSWALAQPAVVRHVGVTEPLKYANVQEFKAYFESGSHWYEATPSYTPVPGDLIFFNTDEDTDADHMGIVLAVKEGKVYTLEGNSFNRVRAHSYVMDPDDPGYTTEIMGYGELPNASE